MSEKIYINGKLLSVENAAIAIDDRGFLLGDGLFETLRCEQNRVVYFEQHWARLQKGCEILGIPLPLSAKKALDQIQMLLKENKRDKSTASIRITLTRGSGLRGLNPPKSITPTVMIRCFDIPPKQKPSISVMHSTITINEHSLLRQFKSLHYAEHILARQEAIKAGFDDALLYNTQGFLVSATAANLFLMIEGEILTPPLSAGALPGIQRQHMINQAKQRGIPLRETNLRREDCDQAESAFITNSIIQSTPIHQVENRSLILPSSLVDSR